MNGLINIFKDFRIYQMLYFATFFNEIFKVKNINILVNERMIISNQTFATILIHFLDLFDKSSFFLPVHCIHFNSIKDCFFFCDNFNLFFISLMHILYPLLMLWNQNLIYDVWAGQSTAQWLLICLSPTFLCTIRYLQDSVVLVQ